MILEEFKSDSHHPSNPLAPPFFNASTDMLYLLERGYPAKVSVDLAGNRYRLSSVQRSILRRGIAPKDTAARRKEKRLSAIEVKGQALSIDSCNVIALIGNYLSGFFVYIASDGFTRDTAESSGVFRNDEHRRLSVRMTVTALAKLKPGPLHFYIDEPHTHSRDLAGDLRAELGAADLSAKIDLVRSADRVLKGSPDVIASGDSEIIESVDKAFDLSRYVLETNFEAMLPELNATTPADI